MQEPLGCLDYLMVTLDRFGEFFADLREVALAEIPVKNVVIVIFMKAMNYRDATRHYEQLERGEEEGESQ